MWDPTTYLRFGDERSRPFADLLARVAADTPREVYDLGCGPGTLTGTLADRWPDARVHGMDSSPDMIARAVAAGGPVRYAVGDVRSWVPGPAVDVVVSNAVLHWVPGHEQLLTGWAERLPAGAWLAVQVPGNDDAPSHRALRSVAADPAFVGRLSDAVRPRPVPAAAEYARLLARAGCAVDAWETTYTHVLPVGPDGGHPVLRWLEGTALRPARAALGDGPEWADFQRALAERLAAAYPVDGGVAYFPFRRVFVVARTAGGR
ncbi:MAG TPA: trans-aconitate 2-methyltransferase [Pilimelia sp.]|nr:trans-aconitate 2-methyltransferase [Pilimelia sp.]